MNEKLYFRDKDNWYVEDINDILRDAKDKGLSSVTAIEAIPDEEDYVWCSLYGEPTQRDECRKSMCSGYESKSGRCVCSNRGQLFRHGETVTFKVDK